MTPTISPVLTHNLSGNFRHRSTLCVRPEIYLISEEIWWDKKKKGWDHKLWSFCRNANHLDSNSWATTSKDDQSSRWRKTSVREFPPLNPYPELETIHIWELLAKCRCYPSSEPGEERAKIVAGARGFPVFNVECLLLHLQSDHHQCGEQCLWCIFKPPALTIRRTTPDCQDKKVGS